MKKLVKVYPTTHGPMLNMFYTYEEAVDLFGEPEDWELEEHYVDIPEELADRFTKAKEELFKVEEEFTKVLKKRAINYRRVI